jgi:hypothetical protein
MSIYRKKTVGQPYFGLAYYGNYVGPGWSAGRLGPSVPYGVGPPAIDELDEAARQHDDAFSSSPRLGYSIDEADRRFYAACKRIGTVQAIAAGQAVMARNSWDKLVGKNIENRPTNMPPMLPVSPRMTPRKRGRSDSFSSEKKQKMPKKFRQRLGFGNAPGQYGGSFGTAEAYESKLAQKAAEIGWIQKLEGSNTKTESESIVLTVSLATRELMKTILFALIRRTIAKSAYVKQIRISPTSPLSDIMNGTTASPSDVRMQLAYFITPVATALTTTNIDVDATTTLDSFCNSILTQVFTIFDSYPQAQLYNYQIQPSKTASLDRAMGSFETLKCEFMTKTEVFIQNRAKNVDASAQQDQLIATTMNPLTVVQYHGNGNGPSPRFDRAGTAANFCASKLNGLRVINTGEIIGEEFSASQFRNCTKKYIDNITPGAIKKIVVQDNGKDVNIASMFKLIVNGEVSTDTKTKFGSYKMLYFENMVNLSAENLDIAYEVNVVNEAVVYGGFAQNPIQEYTDSIAV